jgi:hypothetical protein
VTLGFVGGDKQAKLLAPSRNLPGLVHLQPESFPPLARTQTLTAILGLQQA